MNMGEIIEIERYRDKTVVKVHSNPASGKAADVVRLSAGQSVVIPVDESLQKRLGDRIDPNYAMDRICRWLHENIIHENGRRMIVDSDIEPMLNSVRLAVELSNKERA